jgi:hypothetical protein
MAALNRSSTVCTLVPFYDCQSWLGDTLESLVTQSRPPDAVVVIDDASPEPPLDVVRAFPGVTLLVAADNGGPYRLVQKVIEMTRFDAYLFQDADDWSAFDRLEVLLQTAEETDAELVGSHEVRVLVEQGDIVPVRYPLDVNEVLRARPTAFPLLHPTSLVARRLVTRLGGFATGLRFSGDAEFLRRAGHVARLVNADHFGYFRRKRAGSLTTASETGLGSPMRRQVQEMLAERARANAQAVARGAAPDLAPWRRAPEPNLRLLAGPAPGDLPVRSGWTGSVPRAPASGGATREPVFVIGPPRAGDTLLAWALSQHPAFRSLTDSRWLARSAIDIVARTAQEAAPSPAGFAGQMAGALARVAAGGSPRRWVATGTEVADAAWALANLFPAGRFVFVCRQAEQAVATLLAAPTADGAYYTRDLAYRQWVKATRTGLDLEIALGADRVLRVDHADLLRHPERELERCLGFLGARFVPACVRPLKALDRDLHLPGDNEPLSPAIAEQVTELTLRLMTESAPRAEAAEAIGRLAKSLGRHQGGGGSLVEKVRDAVARTVPEGAVVVVASRGDPRLLNLPGAVGWHYPQVDGGVYAGHHPASSQSATEHLEQLRARGAEYLVFPSSSLWWMSYYGGLRSHLDRHYRIVAFQDDAALIYHLMPEVPNPSAPVLHWAEPANQVTGR